MAYGEYHKKYLEMTPEKVLSNKVIDDLQWEPLETKPGDLVLFDSYIPHRSGPNQSNKPRRAAYITYNPKSQQNCREKYYRHKRTVFPPDVERIPGRSYADSGIYNIGNPIRN